MESFYGKLYDFAGGNTFIINVFIGTAVVNSYYWLINVFFISIDYFQPRWAIPYKIQEEKMPTWDKYKNALKVALINQTIVGFIGAYLFSYIAGSYTGVSYSKTSIPSWGTFFWQLVCFILIEEVGFYYSHRLFHHPRIYKYIHKMHHEWTAPVSITSIYAHPVEHLFSNLLPVLAGPTLLGTHVTTMWLWACIAITSTTSSHSGYHFPLQLSPESHDYHHKVFNENFGVLGWLDTLHGTNTTFRAAVESKRNHTTYQMKPIKEQFPDRKSQ